jgi:hypothetical protein
LAPDDAARRGSAVCAAVISGKPMVITGAVGAC